MIIELTYLISWWGGFTLCVRFNNIFFLPNTLLCLPTSNISRLQERKQNNDLYLTGIITTPSNIIAHIIHTAFDRISIAPNYKYILGSVDKMPKNNRAVPPCLGGVAHGMLGAIIPAGMYEFMQTVPHSCVLKF